MPKNAPQPPETGCRLLRRLLTQPVETHDGLSAPPDHPLYDAVRSTLVDMAARPKVVDDFDRADGEPLDWKALHFPFDHFWIETRFGPHPEHCGACIDRIDNFTHPNPEVTRAYGASVFSEHVARHDRVFMLATLTLFMNESGDVVVSEMMDKHVLSEIAPKLLGTQHERLKEAHLLAAGAFMTIARSLHVLTSRNIELYETVDPRGPRKPKAARVPFENVGHRYYTLVLNDPKYRPGGSGNRTGTMPLHVRRGHFAHYGAEYGRGLLFGKYSGRFWVPALDVGDAKNGTIHKDYEIGADWKPAA